MSSSHGEATTISTIFAVLSLIALAGSVAVGLSIPVSRSRPESLLAHLANAVQPRALSLACIVAAIATIGSFYYTVHTKLVNTVIPLTWYIQICTYCLAIFLLIAALRRDTSVWFYAAPIAAIGVIFSVYQTTHVASDHGNICVGLTSCNDPKVWEFGFVSLPFMALCAQLSVIALTTLAYWSSRSDDV